MDWDQLLIGAKVRLRLPPGGEGTEPVEVTGKLLGRDHSKFIELGVVIRDRDPNAFRAVVQLDDGTLILAPLDSIVGRDGWGGSHFA